MPSPAHMTMRRWLVVLLAVLAMLTAGAWMTIKVTVDHLLYRDATSAAQEWAQYLADNVTDLEQIAAGEQPSAASLAFFQAARKAGHVFRYTIFNRDGYSQLVAEPEKIELVDISQFSPEAAKVVKTGDPFVDFKEAQSADLPRYFAAAYVPALVGGQPVAIVAAYVDQTGQRQIFFRTFLIAGTTLCLLTGFAFGVPAIAWYRRTMEKQRGDRHISFLAHHDPLTGLPNRAQFREALSSALAAADPSRGIGLAVHLINVDHFRRVNDTFGTAGGDYLLNTMAHRLRTLTRPEDVAARLGGDEFVVLQTAISAKHNIESLAHRLSVALAAPAHFHEQEIDTTISIGIAIAPEDGDTSEQLLKNAELALYGAKAAGRDCIRFFSPEMGKALRARVELEKIIRDAMRNDQFQLHYQPMLKLGDKRLIGFEALLRLRSPDGTLIPPETFIPLAEETKLIGPIGAMVLRDACRTAATWPEPLVVAVNLSAVQFETSKISEIVVTALAESGLPAHRLELEITESLLLRNHESVMTELATLKSMGASIVMDDFGSGFSSLCYLWQFPFDKIKIDRSFMQGFEENRHDVETVIRSIIALGRELHMQVIVEGAETADQVHFLTASGADQVQGFFFSKPMPATEIAAYLLTEFRDATSSSPERNHNRADASRLAVTTR